MGKSTGGTLTQILKKIIIPSSLPKDFNLSGGLTLKSDEKG